MARILTGIQSSGTPHLGNVLGAIIPAIELSKSETNESLFFIADLHSLTTIKDAEVRTQNVNAVAAAWLAFGFDTDKIFFTDSPESQKSVSLCGISTASPHTQCWPMPIRLRISQKGYLM